jgi:HSP20 family protein
MRLFVRVLQVPGSSPERPAWSGPGSVAAFIQVKAVSFRLRHHRRSNLGGSPMSDVSQKQKVPEAPATRTSDEFGAMVNRMRQPFLALREEINHLFENFAAGRMPLPWQESPLDVQPLARTGMGFGAALPACEVEEREKEYRMAVELPGYEEGEIGIELAGDFLTVKAEHREEKEEKSAERHYTERRYGSATRSFRLPPDVDREGIRASAKNGLLTITLPKKESSGTEKRKIEVSKA